MWLLLWQTETKTMVVTKISVCTPIPQLHSLRCPSPAQPVPMALHSACQELAGPERVMGPGGEVNLFGSACKSKTC